MKLEDQCCTLEQAKKLKELGVKQEGLHKWCYINAHNDYEIDNGDETNSFSAFTVAELGEMLPPAFESGNTFLHKKGFTKHQDYVCVLRNEKGETIGIYHEMTEAQARAGLIINLLENKIITASEVNERMK